MFFGMQIRFFGRDTAVKNVFVNAAGDDEEDERAKDHQMMAHQRMREKNQQHEADRSVEHVLSETDFSTAKVKRCVFASVINKRQKR